MKETIYIYATLHSLFFVPVVHVIKPNIVVVNFIYSHALMAYMSIFTMTHVHVNFFYFMHTKETLDMRTH